MSYFLDRFSQEFTEAVAHSCDLDKSELTLEIANPKSGADLALPLFKAASKLGKNPAELAQQATTIKLEAVQKLEASGGYLNLWLKPEVLADELLSDVKTHAKYGSNEVLKDKTIVTEYSDPNPFKVLHAGHLYTSVVGDSIANLFEAQGANVHRVNFGGDVGRHVAITMWAILKRLGGANPDKLAEVEDHAEWLTAAYVEGNAVFEADEDVKKEVIKLNKSIYQIHKDNDRDSDLAKVYWTCREWSYDYFKEFYKTIGSEFERFYPESQTAPIGLATVKEQQKTGVYEVSDGAVIFDGEKHGLHKRVFINSEGLPTYEAKDVGLIIKKWEDYHFDQSVIITGNDIVEYMKVVLKSIEQFQPKLSEATRHITHGNVKLQGGVKMSSRKGNILRAVDVLDEATAAMEETVGHKDHTVMLGAVKYAFLKQGIGGDVIYDPKESVSLEGNSGPYVQYAAVRISSILRKGQIKDLRLSKTEYDWVAEKDLLFMLARYPQMVSEAATNMEPHKIAMFMYDIARTLNRYYETTKVLGSDQEQPRTALLATVRVVLTDGLSLLGIKVPEKM